MVLSRFSHLIVFLMLVVPASIFAKSIFITDQTEEKILKLEEVQSIASMLVPQVHATTTPVTFKTVGCMQSKLKDDSAYFLQIINDTSKLPSSYIPKNLVNINSNIKTWSKNPVCMTKTTASQLYTMMQDMEKENLYLAVVSAYRSYGEQNAMYKTGSATLNNGSYDRVAPAGKSEHQLGTALDVSSLTKSGIEFASTSESEWLKKNAHMYGFIVSYDDGSQDKTGYMYEPWHLRYIGVENATLLKEGKYTLSYKPVYYKQSWMKTLLGRLQEYMQTQEEVVTVEL